MDHFIRDIEGGSDDGLTHMMESSSDSERASLFSYFERFTNRNKEPQEEQKQELEENIKREEELIQTPFLMQPPSFKSGATDYPPPSGDPHIV